MGPDVLQGHLKNIDLNVLRVLVMDGTRTITYFRVIRPLALVHDKIIKYRMSRLSYNGQSESMMDSC